MDIDADGVPLTLLPAGFCHGGAVVCVPATVLGRGTVGGGGAAQSLALNPPLQAQPGELLLQPVAQTAPNTHLSSHVRRHGARQDACAGGGCMGEMSALPECFDRSGLC